MIRKISESESLSRINTCKLNCFMCDACWAADTPYCSTGPSAHEWLRPSIISLRNFQTSATWWWWCSGRRKRRVAVISSPRAVWFSFCVCSILSPFLSRAVFWLPLDLFFLFFPFYLSFSISWSYKRWASSERSQKRKNKLTMSTQSVRFRGINWPRSLLSGVITMLHVNYKDALKEKKKTKNRAMEWKERTWTGAILCSLLFSYSLNVTIHDRR